MSVEKPKASVADFIKRYGGKTETPEDLGAKDSIQVVPEKPAEPIRPRQVIEQPPKPEVKEGEFVRLNHPEVKPADDGYIKDMEQFGGDGTFDINELNDMNIKLKNVHSITQLSYNYYKKYGKIDSEPIIIKDTIFIPYVNDKSTNVKSYVKQFKFEQKESDNSVSGNINIPSIYNFDTKELTFNENINPYITDLDIKINDTLLVVPTINYKRVCLFWRRPKSINVFVKSSSKLFNLEQTQTIQITK
jgi:hypothetical protein